MNFKKTIWLLVVAVFILSGIDTFMKEGDPSLRLIEFILMWIMQIVLAFGASALISLIPFYKKNFSFKFHRVLPVVILIISIFILVAPKLLDPIPNGGSIA